MAFDYKGWDIVLYLGEKDAAVEACQYVFIIRTPPPNEDGHGEHEHVVDMIVQAEGKRGTFSHVPERGPEHIESRWVCNNFPDALVRLGEAIAFMHPKIHFTVDC